MSNGRMVAMIAMLVAIAGQSVEPARAQTVDATAAAVARPNFPPVEKFFSRPKYANFSLSPDGKLMAALVPAYERINLALIDLDKGTAKLLTSLTSEDVNTYRWIGNQTLEITTANSRDASGLVYLRQIAFVDTSGQMVRNMYPSGRRSPANIIAVLDQEGNDLIIQSNERTETSLDAYRFNPQTNEKKLLTLENPGNVGRFVVDRAGQVRLAIATNPGGTRRTLYYRRSNDDKWTMLREEAVEAASITPIAFDFDNKTLYVTSRDAANGDRSGIYAFDPEANQLGKQIYANPTLDVSALLFDEVRKVPMGIRDNSADGVTWIDPEWKRLQESIDAALPKTRNFIAWSRFDHSKIIVRTESDLQPPVFFLLDRNTHKLQEVAAAYPSLDEKDLSPRRFVRYKARDGLSIPAHLTMPRNPDGAKPPLIVDIHGGPFVPAGGSGYNGDSQFFASRGYAVLQPDFRGTQGYGRAFEQAGWKQWGLAMQDDITDGVKWLIDTGKVDPDRVCLFGASYGGYATLWGLEKEPQMFRCGVAEVAVADLELMFDVSWSDLMRGDLNNNVRNFLIRTLGDPDKDREKMRAVSPLFHADRIQAPLLLAYGAADVRVPLIHGNKMRSALDKNNKSYEWVVYSDEGHGFNKDENVFDFYRRVDAFLAKNLAPRAQ
jgi:dipeptidyl aminopeptidase/acylaminoacyl peptidase